MNPVLSFLQEHNIDYVLHEHLPVFTCEEADAHCGNIPGVACKNLLLRDRKWKRYFLLILPADKRTDLRRFAEIIGEKWVSFASEDALRDKLGLTPGSVSPFGLINDPDATVGLYIDRAVYDAGIVSFHPNINTATLELTRDMFRKFLEITPHTQIVIDL